MKTTVISFNIILAIFFIPKIQYASTIYSNGTGGGVWTSTSSWNSPVPICGDTIIIKAGDVIKIESNIDYSACPGHMVLYINGTLEFPTNGPKLKLPGNSTIFVNVGGLITATYGPGGGNAVNISIGGEIVWKKADGDVPGYAVFGSTSLPIELVSFEAEVNENVIVLKWVTATEINNDYFTVEKSTNIKNWEEVLSTSGAGNSNIILEYSETDDKPIKGISYYRLKQYDYNGLFTYYNIIPVEYRDNSNNLNVYPNPVSNGETINIKNIDGNELYVVLQDATGKKYFSKLIANYKDGELVKIPLDIDIPSGIYVLSAACGNQMCSKRLVIK